MEREKKSLSVIMTCEYVWKLTSISILFSSIFAHAARQKREMIREKDSDDDEVTF